MSRSILYLTCSETPLSVFISCLVDANLKALIKEGEATLAELSEAWSNLYAEYIDLNKDNEQSYLRDLQKDIAARDGELKIIESLLLGLAIVFDKDAQDLLEKLDVSLDLNWDNQEDYQKQLIAANSSLALRRMELQMKEQEYDEYIQNKETGTVDRIHFMKQLRVIARFNKVATIKPNEVTVEEFILMLEEIRENTQKWQEEEK